MEKLAVTTSGRLIKPKEARDYLGISTNAIYALIRCRTFPSIRIGGRYYICADKLEEWLDKATREKKGVNGFTVEERRRA